MGAVTQPKVDRVRPLELVTYARSGRIRIPRFQRSFRWDAQDAVRLFDSILRGYPIGNLLMWRKPAPAEEVIIGELRCRAPEQADAYWVVDGQQRLTTLVGALTATEDTVDRRFRIFYDVSEAEFMSASPSKPVREDWLPVAVAGDNRRLLAWQRDRPWLTDKQFDLCDSVATAIREYEIPVYIVESDNENALREIFDRMNTFGKTLKREEVFQALHAAPEHVRPSGLADLGERVADLRFGKITDKLLMQSVMAVRGGKVDRDFRREFDDDDDRQAAFAATERALRLAVEFIRHEAGIPHIRLLPYVLFLPVLVRFCAVFGAPGGRAAELLRRWIWRGSVVGVAPQGYTVGLRRHASAVEGDPVLSADRLLQLLPPGGEAWQPDLTATSLNRAQAKINVLGLLSRHPVLLAPARGVPNQKREYVQGDRIDRDPLLGDMLESGASPLPLAIPVLGEEAVKDRSLARRFLHPGVAPDMRHFFDNDAAALHSQCFDEKCRELFCQGMFADFLAHRSAVIRTVIADHVQAMALWGFADGPGPEAWFDDHAGLGRGNSAA